MTASYDPAAPVAQERRLWTQKEIEIAQELRANGFTYKQIGEAVGRDWLSVRNKLERPTARIERKWTEQEAKTAQELRANGFTYFQIGEALGRSKDSVWFKLNPEGSKERSRYWRQQNPEKAKEVQRRCRQRSPEKHAEHERRRRALKRSNRNAGLVKLTAQAKAERFALFGNVCAYCSFNDRLTADHVLALAAKGLDEPSNIAPACHSCNCKKNASPVESWYRSQPFFSEARWELIKQHCPGATGQLSLALPM
jgi:predicted HNH restriction endonuclease